MKLIILIGVICLVPGLAWAQTSHIGVYADREGRDCYPEDVVPGVFQVHIVQLHTDGAAAAQFALVAGGGFAGMYLGESVPDPNDIHVGNVITGTSVAWGECLASPVHILTVSYYGEGLSPACSYLEVVADPGAFGGIDTPIWTTCSHEVQVATGGRCYINGDDGGHCVCAAGAPTPVRESTWGSVKALYVDV